MHSVNYINPLTISAEAKLELLEFDLNIDFDAASTDLPKVPSNNSETDHRLMQTNKLIHQCATAPAGRVVVSGDILVRLVVKKLLEFFFLLRRGSSTSTIQELNNKKDNKKIV